MTKQARILLLIPHLGGGGAERVAEQVAKGLDPDRYDVHLGLVTQRNACGYVLPSCITVHGLGARRVRWAGWKLLRLVHRLRPDVILSGMAHLNRLVLLLRPLFPGNTRVIIRENGSVHADGGSANRRLYSKAHAIVCQTRAMAAEITEVAGPCCKLRVLPNPVDVDGIRELARTAPSRWTDPGPHLLAVGRLAPEKGFDLLLQAFARIRDRFPSADLAILGEGRQRPQLEILAWLLGLQGSVHFMGQVDKPAAWFPGATLFVLSSRHEGLPNALLEAAAAGLPIVTTRASEGLVELLDGDAGVWPAADISGNGIGAALEDALGQLQPDQRFAHPWVERFRSDRAMAAYEALVEEQLAEVRQ